MSDSIIASVLAAAALDTTGGVEDTADADGNEPVALGADEADNRAGADDNDEADDDPNAESEAEAEEADNGDERADNSAEENDGDDHDPAKEIVESFPVNDDGEQDVEVVEVAEAASCLALPSKATPAREDRRLAELRGKGFTDAQLRAVGAVLTSTSRRQRKLPVHAAVCSAVMQAYWAGRDRERREADCMKAIRNDGGQLGPVRYYESIIRKHDPLAAAKLLAEHHAQRITAIRYIVTATFNEGRREDAVAKGVDPTTVKYLQVRAK
jgi:hypothetical protein